MGNFTGKFNGGHEFIFFNIDDNLKRAFTDACQFLTR
jgi:hypothetical protein